MAAAEGWYPYDADSGTLAQVSDDEGEAASAGALILEGEEGPDSRGASPRLDPSAFDSSILATMVPALEQTGLIPVDNEKTNSVDDEVVMVDRNGNEQEPEEDMCLDDVEDESEVTSRSHFGAVRAAIKLHWKVIVIISVIVVLSLFTIHQERQERHRQAERYGDEIARVKQELEREKEGNRCQGDWQQDGEDWTLADNCYFNARLGECATKHVEEVTNGLQWIYEVGQGFWSPSTSDESHTPETGDPKQASFSFEAFYEQASEAVVQGYVSAQDQVSRRTREFLKEVEETKNLILEQTRDAVEDGTAFTRPKKE